MEERDRGQLVNQPGEMSECMIAAGGAVLREAIKGVCITRLTLPLRVFGVLRRKQEGADSCPRLFGFWGDMSVFRHTRRKKE
jgi:hypothetical protein